jgi:hypothetical protein
VTAADAEGIAVDQLPAALVTAIIDTVAVAASLDDAGHRLAIEFLADVQIDK